MESHRSGLDLGPIFKKLGHSLEEIRVRALQNILSKLEHNLLCDVDLVQEKHLLIRLLEWFNFPSCPKQSEVLGLLLRLSKHSSAAGLLLDVGAVEFLTQLRPNIQVALHTYIDQVLDNLFKLPSVPVVNHTQECLYKGHKHTAAQAEEASLPSHFLQASEASLHSTETGSHHVTQEAQYHHGTTYASPSEPKMGYFSKENSQDDAGSNQHPVSASAGCFKFSTFPWVALTPTDRHVLASTDNSLKSQEATMVTSACDFLSDVVFQDFPAEIFLQRPSIVKSLISLLSVPPVAMANVAVSSMKTLQDLTSCLQARIYYYQDPALYTPKQDFNSTSSSQLSSGSSLSSRTLGSSDTRPSVIGRSDARHRGDGRDGDNTSSGSSRPSQSGRDMREAMGEETDIEDIQSLQFMQWTTPQFCMAVLEKTLPNLKSSHKSMLVQSLQLLWEILGLMGQSVVADALWDDNSVPARDVIEKLQENLEILGEILQLHHHGNQPSRQSEAEVILHRISFIGTAIYTTELLKSFVPMDKVQQAVPSTLAPLLGLLCQDHTLTYSFPDISHSLLPYLRSIDEEGHQVYCRAVDVSRSITDTCSFLLEMKNLNEENLQQQVLLAESALASIPYHYNAQLADGCVHLCSYIFKKSSPNPAASRRSHGVLLRLLAHPITIIRQQAYASCVNITKDALGIENVTNPTSSSTQLAAFLLDHRVLYQICCFGVNDSVKPISELAQELLVYLLQSQLLFPSTRWQQLLEAIVPVLSVLQGFAGLKNTLGQCIVGLLEVGSQAETGALPLLERFRGTLRLLFSPESRVRSEGLGRLAWFLTNEEDTFKKIPTFSELDVTNLSNIFQVATQRVLEDEDTSRSVFKVESMKKVYDIFTSATVEQDVRKSSAEQLAIMLQDPALHLGFSQLGGVQTVVDLLHKGVRKDGDNSLVGLLASLVSMLRHLVHHNSGLRHDLAHQKPIYYTLVRCALIGHNNEHAQYEVSHLMALLLFDEMFTIDAWSFMEEVEAGSPKKSADPLRLPAVIANRYHLPFKVPTNHTTSPFALSLPSDPDPLTSGAPAQMMRLTWNVAWHDGVRALIKHCASEEQKLPEEEGWKLQLLPLDKVLLRTTHLPSSLQQYLHDISNATSHSMVSTALLQLLLYLVAARTKDTTAVLHALNWHSVLDRFLQVMPSSNADENLLAEILSLIVWILKGTGSIPPQCSRWLISTMNNPQGALLGLVSRTESPTENPSQATITTRRLLNRQLLQFLCVFVARLPYNLSQSSVDDGIRGDVAKHVLMRLNLTDAAHFYNLASLEATLLSLMHITARPGWSVGCSQTDSLTLCLQMLHSLLEVISAFHVGRGGMSMSYMGRGVTRCSTLCLRHLAYEMATQLQSKDWPRNWLFSRQATPHSVGESGLHWLIPLWTYRDTEVRAAGLGISVALASTESGRITMTTQCQHIPGGIWGAAFSILLDQSECSLVRQQAALLLVNLTSQPMPSGSVETAANVWQGPVVRNEETQVSLVGLSALLALLHHSQFYTEMMALLSNYYPQPAIHPVSIATGSSPFATPLASRSTVTTSGTASSPGSSVRNQTDLSTPGQMYTSTPAERPLAIGQNGESTMPTVPGQAATDDQQHGDNRSTRQDPSGGTEGDGRTPQGPTSITATSDASTPGSILGVGGMAPSTSSASGSSAGSGQDYQSVATPCLVSAVCQLLHNLLTLASQDTLLCMGREGMLKVLASIIDVNLLEAYTTELQVMPHRRQYTLAFQGLVRLNTQILDLLRLCSVQDSAICWQILQEKAALKQIVQLLGINYEEDADSGALCACLWEAVMKFYTSILQLDGQLVLQELTPIFTQHWGLIASSIVVLLQDPRLKETSLILSTQQFLALLLSEEGKRVSKVKDKSTEGDSFTITHMLNLPLKKGDTGDLFLETSGALLCSCLIKLYDAVATLPMDQVQVQKLAIVNALKTLLAISITAKEAALEAGLMEITCEHLKHLHIKLSMEALDVNKLSHGRKKENSIISELVLTLHLLRNFMYDHYDAKLAAYESGVSNVVHKLWCWGQIEPLLMTSLLMLLGTYTARCPQACSSLTLTSSSSVEDKSVGKYQHSSNSMVHALIKLVQRQDCHKQHLSAGFAVLATLSLSQECRGIMWKSNFLQEFSKLCPKKTKKTKGARNLETLWLDLLVNLSFSTEGQQLILRISDAVSLLLEYGASSSPHHQRCAVLILRNLCFHSSNKQKLLANDKLIPFLLEMLRHGSEETKILVSSALLALVYNSQKAKASLKTTQVMHKLQDTYNQANNTSAKSTYMEKISVILRDVLEVLRD